MNWATCIWCLQASSDTDREHIFLEALGCPPDLTLPGTDVCRQCNISLAHLDRSVADEFDFVGLLRGIKRKRKRSPEIHSRGNVYGCLGMTGPELFFNLEPHPITLPNGKVVQPFRNKARDVRPAVKVHEKTMEMDFSLPFGQGKNFVRGITKIAFNAFSFRSGSNLASAPTFNAVRSFVLHNMLQRRILLSYSPHRHVGLAIAGPWHRNDDDYCIQVDILGASFLVDLTPEETILKEVEERLSANGSDGWTVLT